MTKLRNIANIFRTVWVSFDVNHALRNSLKPCNIWRTISLSKTQE